MMNGDNSNNRNNMVSPEELALGSANFSSPGSNGGGMQANPFSQTQQGFSSVNSSTSQQQQNPFQPVSQVASTPANNFQQQVVSTPVTSISQPMINQVVNNTPQQMFNQPINNNFQVSGSQQVGNEVQNFFLHPQPINESENKKEKNKNITKSLFIAMAIIFLIFGIATVYVINIPSELECSTTSSESGVTYSIIYNYSFKNETLKDEIVTMSIDLGSYYESEKDFYIEEGKKALEVFIDRGFKVDVIEQKPLVQIKLHGDGETLMKVHNVNVYSDLSYKTMKLTAENNNFVCK